MLSWHACSQRKLYPIVLDHYCVKKRLVGQVVTIPTSGLSYGHIHGRVSPDAFRRLSSPYTILLMIIMPMVQCVSIAHDNCTRKHNYAVAAGEGKGYYEILALS